MRILCFGDSNTYGYDPRSFFGDRYGAADRWVDLLAKQTGWAVINAGENGRSIPRTPYFPADAEHAWDMLLVMLGTNDLLQGASAAEAAARMKDFLHSLLPCPKQILLISPPPMKRGAWVPSERLVSESIQLAKAYRVLAEELDVSFLDTSDWNIDLAFDGVHFTEAGHHAFADRLAKAIEKIPELM